MGDDVPVTVFVAVGDLVGVGVAVSVVVELGEGVCEGVLEGEGTVHAKPVVGDAGP